MVPAHHSLKATAYLSAVVDHVHPFKSAHLMMAASSRAAECEASQTLFFEHDDEFTALQMPQCNREHLWDVVEQTIGITLASCEYRKKTKASLTQYEHSMLLFHEKNLPNFTKLLIVL